VKAKVDRMADQFRDLIHDTEVRLDRRTTHRTFHRLPAGVSDHPVGSTYRGFPRLRSTQPEK
jgi:hypothetical protein